jgi:hypothetical protein
VYRRDKLPETGPEPAESRYLTGAQLGHDEESAMHRALVALLIAAVLSMAGAPSSYAASIPAHARWKSSNPNATWHNRALIVYNNEWNPAAGPQIVWADSYQHWGVQSTQQAGNTAVETYPCVGKVYGGARVSSLSMIQNSFAESMPANRSGLHAEAADDVWLDNYRLEMMIWVDNIGQSFGSDKLIGHVQIRSQKFAIWRNGTEFIFALNHNEARGQTDILSSIRWLMRRGYVPARATLSQVDFGWEISSTNSRPADFTLTNYQLRTQSS